MQSVAIGFDRRRAEVENGSVLGAKNDHYEAWLVQMRWKFEDNQVFTVENFDCAWNFDSHDLKQKISVSQGHSSLN